VNQLKGVSFNNKVVSQICVCGKVYSIQLFMIKFISG